MSTYRKQTSLPTEQPVRFYKFVALTFLLLTIFLLSVIMFMSSKRATITIESKASPVDITDSIVVGNGEKTGSIKGQVLSSQVSIEEVFFPTGTQEVEDIATGTIILHNDSNLNQSLIPKTRLLSKDGVLFRMKDRAIVPANGTISVEVYADEKGAKGNIEPTSFTVPGLSDAKQKVIFGTSESVMTGGIKKSGVLSSDDLKKAKEVMRKKLQEKGEADLISNGPSLSEFSTAFILSDDVYDSTAQVGEEVAEFTLVGKATIVGVFYNEKDLKSVAEKSLMRRAVDDVETVRPSSQQPTVNIEEYNLENKTATIKVFYDGISVLNPESRQLDKNMFYGKNEDEIRRYLLKLDHVRSVIVKFSPAWINTVPYVADHVDVIVKEVN